jgi:hypothetical protein
VGGVAVEAEKAAKRLVTTRICIASVVNPPTYCASAANRKTLGFLPVAPGPDRRRRRRSLPRSHEVEDGYQPERDEGGAWNRKLGVGGFLAVEGRGLEADVGAEREHQRHAEARAEHDAGLGFT